MRPRRRWHHAISQLAIEHLLLLPLGAAIAMVWVNLEAESYYRFRYQLSFVVNDVAMMFYFGLITKEVVEATAHGGVLHSWRRALFPVVAAVGAAAVPALLYVRAVEWIGEPGLKLAWPTTLGIDVVVTYLVGRFVFGRTGAVPFLLLLVIIADALAFLAMGIFDPTRDLHLARAGLMMLVAIAVAAGLRSARVQNFWPYLLLGGSLSWFALFLGNLHPALALVPIIPFLPHAAHDRGFMVDARPAAKDALSQFEIWWRYPAHITLFFFGLVNAGVRLHAIETGALGVPIAVIIGRPLGVLVGAGVAVALGMHMPFKVGWRELFVIGVIAAIGFSIGLFMSNELIGPGEVRAETSMGVLLTLIAAPVALLLSRALRVGRYGPG